MPESFSREQRRSLESAVRTGAALRCPACGAAMTRQVVQPPANVPYVRHRVWLLCTGCKRSVSVDVAR